MDRRYTFIEATGFTATVKPHFGSDEASAELQAFLLASPDAGAVIPARDRCASFAGKTPGAARANAVGCASSTSTSPTCAFCSCWTCTMRKPLAERLKQGQTEGVEHARGERALTTQVLDVPKAVDATIPKSILSLAGEYFVAAELSRWGFMAAITYGSAKSVDIQVTNPANRRLVWIEAKTTQKTRGGGEGEDARWSSMRRSSATRSKGKRKDRRRSGPTSTSSS